MKVTAAACLALVALAGGCSLVVGGGIEEFGPADFAGQYSLTVTNGDNGCGFSDWRPNETNGHIPFTVTQDGEELSGVIEGFVGGLFNLVLGNNHATGKADGSEFEMRVRGMNRQSPDGGCGNYRIDAIMVGDLEGDFLEGTTTYTVVTTDWSIECVQPQGCETIQTFKGSRAPQ